MNGKEFIEITSNCKNLKEGDNLLGLFTRLDTLNIILCNQFDDDRIYNFPNISLQNFIKVVYYDNMYTYEGTFINRRLFVFNTITREDFLNMLVEMEINYTEDELEDQVPNGLYKLYLANQSQPIFVTFNPESVDDINIMLDNTEVINDDDEEYDEHTYLIMDSITDKQKDSYDFLDYIKNNNIGLIIRNTELDIVYDVFAKIFDKDVMIKENK